MPKKPKSEPQTALAPSLRGEGAIDEPLVDEAVRQVNRLYAAKGVETARVIGEYLVGAFFGGDPGSFTAREKGHASFRALEARDDLGPSYTFLWYSVRFLPQLRALPADVADALPMSHHRLLIHVKDEDQKAKLAQQAVTKDLSKRELEDEIRKLRERTSEGATRGRKALPAFVKAFNGIKKITKTLDGGALDDTAVLNYGLEEAQKYLADVESTLAKLGQVRESLAARVAALAPRT